MLATKFFRHGMGALAATAFMTASLVAHAASETEETAAVAKAVETMRTAMLASDGAALGKLVENDLTYGHSSGRIQDKAAFLKELDGTHSFKSLSLSNQTINVVGDDAVVRHIFDSENNQPDGKITNAHIGVVQVWKKHQDGWRLLARQAYSLPKQ
ncbi:nuclear transport factor 2 family protein [Trinickia sp. LjRoot230]|uniref:nuclear transport factor 2 family protein n=1 Tax=Trinickia sp. LjRoot230 TaxID=3342288 RepID=UPI003ED08E1A